MRLRNILLATFILTTPTWATNPAPYEEWKTQAREKYKMTEAQIAECAGQIRNPNDWDTYRRQQYQVPVTLKTRDEAMAAVESQLKLLQTEADACQLDCDRLSAQIAKLFATPAQHPSLMDFETYKHTIIESATSKLVIPLSALSDESRVYNLPTSKYESENARRSKMTQYVFQARMQLAPGQSPNTQFWRISRLDMMFSAIARKALAELAPSLIVKGLAGPFLSDCSQVWASYEARELKLRDHTMFAFRMENELVRWIYNALDTEGMVGIEDFKFLESHWGHTIEGENIRFTKSGEYMEKLRTFHLVRQNVLFCELYLRGFRPEDFGELINNKINQTSPSWLNILSLVQDYSKQANQKSGVYAYHHSGHMKNAIRTCLDTYLPARLEETRLLLGINAEPQKVFPHEQAELQPASIRALKTGLFEVTELCLAPQEVLQTKVASMLAPANPSSDETGFANSPTGMELILSLSSLAKIDTIISMIDNKRLLDLADDELRTNAKNLLSLVKRAIPGDRELENLKRIMTKAKAFHEQMLLFSHFLSLENILSDAILMAQGHVKLLDEEDKDLYFKILDRLEVYIPLLNRFLESTDLALNQEK